MSCNRNFNNTWCPKELVVRGFHLFFISYNFVDLFQMLLSFVLFPVWGIQVDCSIHDSHCLFLSLLFQMMSLFQVCFAILWTGITTYHINVLIHLFVFFLLLSKQLVNFACFSFYHCEALSWHFYRTIYFNSEVPCLNGDSYLRASPLLYIVRTVPLSLSFFFFPLALLLICLCWISFGTMLHIIVKVFCNSC